MDLQEYYRMIDLLRFKGHEIFSITFRRRTDQRDGLHKAGELRSMTCRLHVKKNVKGTDPNRGQRDRENSLITVYEMAEDRSGYKSIPVDSIIAVSGVDARNDHNRPQA